ncbi:MAG: hypothetical protein JWM54_1751 [Acidobacteriaceae bacterium]|jgi:hypothetical protein|nr:hypothetical protein [Acidobacteriaceae bacterium]
MIFGKKSDLKNHLSANRPLFSLRRLEREEHEPVVEQVRSDQTNVKSLGTSVEEPIEAESHL